MEWIWEFAKGAIAGLVVWAFLEWRVIRPMQRRLAASIESTADMGWLMEQQRKTYGEQIDTFELIVDAALNSGELEQARRRLAEAERDEARAASALALTFYGKALERAA